MGDKEIFIEKLKKFKKEDIIITNHAILQSEFREIPLEEVKENILNPTKLVFVERQKTLKPEEEKFNCYFAYSENLCHRYIIVLNYSRRKVIICTIIKINRRWQHLFEKNGTI